MIGAGRLRDTIRIERPVSDTSFGGAGSGSWALVADNVAAEVMDMLPSRGEKLAQGINVATRPARVRIRYRDGVDASMRFVMGARIMHIVAGPAELLGRRRYLEFMVEDYSTAGTGA